jgi:hypothetical protein
MERIEKCELAKELGYTYNADTGDVIGLHGKPLKTKNNSYLEITGSKNNRLRLLCHTFAWWWVNGTTPNYIDHINMVKTDNRICNLRPVTNQQNAFNVNAKGYYWDSINNKFKAQIMLNGKQISLGRYKTEEDARHAYLLAKEKYHII